MRTVMRVLRNGYRLPALLFAACIAGCGGGNDGNFGPPSGNGDTLALTSNNRLVSFNRSSPNVLGAVNISGLQSNETLLGIDIRPSDGQLYALGSTGRVYTINTSNGTATLKSSLMADPNDADMPYTGLSGVDYGVDFNPVPDRLRVISDTGQNLRINVDTGAVITDGTIRSQGTTAARTGVTGTAYTNSFAAACRTTLFYVDTTNNRLLTTPDPNAGFVTEVGNLGVVGGSVNGMEIVTGANGTNTALVVLTVGGTSGSSASQTLYTINLTNGAAAANGTVSGLNSGESIRGLTAAPPSSTPTQLAGNILGLTESNKLITFNNASPQKICTTTAISGLAQGESVLGIDMRPSADPTLAKVYALGSTSNLYTLNTSTGVATLAAQLDTNVNGTEFGVDFNPVVDRLRIVSDNGQNMAVDVSNGSSNASTASLLNPAGSTVTAAAYTNSFAGATSTTLYVIDTTGDRLMIQGRPPSNPNLGDLTLVGPLGIDIQTIAGFEINPVNNQALIAVTTAGSTTSDLYSVELTTGAATRINTLGGGERIRGITATINPQVTAMGLTDDGFLVMFKVSTPGTIDNTLPITGLQSGEALIGLDIRPVNGRIYAVSDAGTLYTLDPTSGGATVLPTLAADPNDMAGAPPYTGLSGNFFAFDFNPVADRLRIVSDAGQNLRINVDTSLVTTDGPTTGGFQPVAAAYTQNFVPLTPTPAVPTRLLVIDRLASTLLLQDPPNNGTLTQIGQLSPSFAITPSAGFDIVGGDNGLVVAALRANGATQSTLYQVNITTGAATAVAPIGQDGMLLRALALRLQ